LPLADPERASAFLAMVALQSLSAMTLRQLDEISMMKLSQKPADIDALSEASTALGSSGLGVTPFSSVGSQHLGSLDLGPVEEDFDFDFSTDSDTARQSPRLCSPPGLDVCAPPGLERASDVVVKRDQLARENLRLQQEHALLMQTSLAAAQRAQVAAQYAMAAQYGMLPQAMACHPTGLQSVPICAAAPPGLEQTLQNCSGVTQRKSKTAAKAQAKAAVAQHPVSETTVCLRNIPKQFSRLEVVEFLNEQGFGSKFDFVYAPFDFKFNSSVGFAFINCISHEIALEVFEVLNGFCWETTKPGKECKVNWASPHQGLQAHIEHFRNSPVMHVDVKEEYKPALFKDGQQVEFPKPTKELRAPRMRSGHMTGRRSQFVDQPQA